MRVKTWRGFFKKKKRCFSVREDKTEKGLIIRETEKSKSQKRSK